MQENKKNKAIYRIGVALLTGACLLLGYARHWESRQPEEDIADAVVTSIEHYSNDNDLHWHRRGYRITVEGRTETIDFPRRRWDNTVNLGDTVDLVVRANYPLFGRQELDGRAITDN